MDKYVGSDASGVAPAGRTSPVSESGFGLKIYQNIVTICHRSFQIFLSFYMTNAVKKITDIYFIHIFLCNSFLKIEQNVISKNISRYNIGRKLY